MVKGDGEVWFRRHDNVNAFTQRNMEIFTKVDHDVAVLSIAPS